VCTERCPRHMCCVEVGVECDRVVGVTLQCAKTVVMRIAGVRVIERVLNRLDENGVRADLDEGAVVRTGGRDRLAEPDRVANVGHPMFGAE
jgi:hypothetical protein